MKTKKLHFTIALIMAFFFMSVPQAEAQIFKKLKKKVDDVTSKKLEQKTEKETEKVMDTLLGNGKQNPSQTTPNSGNGDSTGGSTNTDTPGNTQSNEVVEMYSKSDWVAGENVILYEDFSDAPIGDFPQLWDGNAAGEVITLSNNENIRWFKLFNKGFFLGSQNILHIKII